MRTVLVYLGMELTWLEDLKVISCNADSLNGALVLDVRRASLGSEHLVTGCIQSFHKPTRLYVTLVIPTLEPPSSELVLHNVEVAITIDPFCQQGYMAKHNIPTTKIQAIQTKGVI